MAKTSIEWADHSINPIRARNLETGAVGHFCEKVSPGCANCYSSAWNRRVRPSGTHLIGTGLEFLPANREKVATFLDQSKLQEVLRRQKPTRYFWCDMTDLFGEWVLDAEIDACFAVMALTPRHTHLVLTKRPERMRAYLSEPLYNRIERIADCLPTRGTEREGFVSLPLLNVHLGTSVENQRFADERKQSMQQLADAGWLTWVSYEPALEHVDFWDWLPREVETGQTTSTYVKGIRWLVVGGESGAGARPFDLAWGRSIVAQCKAAGVPVFCKQMGRLPVADGAPFWLRNRKGGTPSEWPAGDWPREFPVTGEGSR